MVFSSPVFLFLFLPLTLLCYFVAPRAIKNLLLLLASLFFYAWGEELYVVVLLTSIIINFGVGLLISNADGQRRLVMLWMGVLANIALLGYFKYFGFFLGTFGLDTSGAPALPIGISFFTFQALSYLIDLYYKRIAVQRNPLNLALYISLFPQLIAGPIVRYAEVEAALANRVTARTDFAAGMHQFVRGLAKKTLIADPIGLIADQIFAIPDAGLSPEIAWIGAICYALQLYFDFSAYSDMAIGLGRILGFKFPPNFNYPYLSQSITEFWRRWHMTLSRWFRDYLYIPLGGNRHGAARTYLNLWIVFLATGLWHGAAWTFVAWGAFHGVFLIIEKLGFAHVLTALPRPVRHIYLLLVVLVGWVLFRSETFGQASAFIHSMFLFETGAQAQFYPLARYLDAYSVCVIAAAIVLSIGFRPWIAARMQAPQIVHDVWFWLLLVTAIISVGAASYSPFIYFRF